MPAVVVPDLKRKLTLLRTYPTGRTWAELAEPFGVSHKALHSWQDGTATRAPNTIPGSALTTFIRLIGEMLPNLGRRTSSSDLRSAPPTISRTNGGPGRLGRFWP